MTAPNTTRQDEAVKLLQKELASKQAKIDSLMLEYCPDEMTVEQTDEWARHQKPAGSASIAEPFAYAWKCPGLGDWRIEKLGDGRVPPTDTIALYTAPQSRNAAMPAQQADSDTAHIYRDIHGNASSPEAQEFLRKLDNFECIAPNEDPIRCARVRCNLGKRCAAHEGHEAPMHSVDKQQAECGTCGGAGGWQSSAVADCPSSWATCPACTPVVEGKILAAMTPKGGKQ